MPFVVTAMISAVIFLAAMIYFLYRLLKFSQNHQAKYGIDCGIVKACYFVFDTALQLILLALILLFVMAFVA